MESIISVNPSEYAPFYETYVRRVPEGEISEILSAQIDDTLGLLNAVPVELETYRYGTGKWSVREVVGHVIDVERVFSFRALAFARGDSTPLPGMDQVQYAAVSGAGTRPLSELAAELASVRAATVALFRSFSAEAWSREGIASGCSFTVRSFPFIIAGHELHHRAGLAENYLSRW